MTEPVILSVRTWTTKEPDPDDRHRLPVRIRWTETVVLRDATPEELMQTRKDAKWPT